LIPHSAIRNPHFHGFRSRVVLWSCSLVVLLSCGLFTFRAPLLRTAARAWIINDPVTRTDAIVLLGGGLETRPFAAARLYAEHAAPKILVSQPKLPPTAQMGLTTPEFVIAREVLLSNGVPESAIEVLGTNMTSTFDEARALKAWLSQNQAHTVIIPTDLFHTRRARWIFSKMLRNTGARVFMEAIPVREYGATNWWQHEEGLIAFQNEVIKSVYYHVKY
jgi:uncharacterized SAM-binding protein YcdF (DUF218 family)